MQGTTAAVESFVFEQTTLGWVTGELRASLEPETDGCETSVTIEIDGMNRTPCKRFCLSSQIPLGSLGPACHEIIEVFRAGGGAEAVQIGEVEITPVQDKDLCSQAASDCPASSGQECQKTPDENLRTFYDGATRMQQLYHSENIQVATDNPKSFSNDKARLARRCESATCLCTGCYMLQSRVMSIMQTEQYSI